MKTLLVDLKERVLTITLNRPEVRNAFNDELIAELTHIFKKDAPDVSVKAVVLKGAGAAFSAGGDLKWMAKSASYTRKQNRADAAKLSTLLQAINRLPKPVIGSVHGAALGGGMGLTAVCDVVVAAEKTLFGFTEVKVGLVPAVISPFVLQKIGPSHARAFFLTGERFEAQRAYEIGLIHRIVPAEQLEPATDGIVKMILEGSPKALKKSKVLLEFLTSNNKKNKYNYTSNLLAEMRASPEGKEGIKAFLEKRKANW
ncbi:MAG: enoyl-CoA hydratase-related protein [Deltaproteobacteria bacterium]|nr:enoyl-CoA hydratase-related protein [Deltaproteobacteria bacterium]